MLLHFYDINNKLLSTLIVKDFYTIDDLKINLFLDIGLGDMDLVLKKGLSSIKLEPTSKVSDYHLTRNSQIIVIPKASTIQNFCNVLSSYMKQEDNYKKYRLDVWLYKVGTEEDGEHIIIQLYNYMNKHDPERQWGIGLTTKTYDQTIYTRSMIPLDNSLYLHEVYDTTYNFIRDRCEHHQKDIALNVLRNFRYWPNLIKTFCSCSEDGEHYNEEIDLYSMTQDLLKKVSKKCIEQ